DIHRFVMAGLVQARPGHPRLGFNHIKTWMPATSDDKRGHDESHPSRQGQSRDFISVLVETRYSPLPPPSCLSLANTAWTSRSSDFLAGAAGAGGSSLGAVVTEAGSSVAPCASTGAGFSLAARCTSRSRSIWEQSPSVTGSSGVRLAEFQ